MEEQIKDIDDQMEDCEEDQVADDQAEDDQESNLDIGDIGDNDNETSDSKSKFKYGIIYLSFVPDGLNVTSVRDIMCQWGEVGRVYLEPDENNLTSKRKKYIEGWVEFKKKRVAKDVAKTLNGTVLKYGKKHSRVSGQIWSIKYLHRFKWAQLTDQLAHHKAVEEQKRRFEMSQAKKQVDFYQKMTERSRMMKKKKKGSKTSDSRHNSKESVREKKLNSRQNKPISQGSELTVPVGVDLLSSIFKKVT